MNKFGFISMDSPKYKSTFIFILSLVLIFMLLVSIFSYSFYSFPKKVNLEWLLDKFQGNFDSDIFISGIKEAIKNINDFDYDSLGFFSGIIKFFASGAKFSLFFFNSLLTLLNFISTIFTILFSF